MSRNTIYHDQRLVLVTGNDHILGEFIQLYDNDLISETPEGEGLIFDWSQGFGTSTNYTGNPVINDETRIWSAVTDYIAEHNPKQYLMTGLQTISLN